MPNHILIVTNDVGDRKSLQKAIANASDGPYRVDCVEQLASALERLKEDDTDAILVDMTLPDSQGIDTFDRLFAAAPHIPILTLSTLDDEQLAREAVERGAQGFLSKGHFDSYLVPQSLRNIIQRMAVEQKFYIEKKRAEITLNAISDAVIGTDAFGNVDYLNFSGEQLTGWTKEAAQGHHISEVMPLAHGATGQPVPNPLALILTQDTQTALPFDAVIVRHDARDVAIEDSTATIWGPTGKLAGGVMVFHDITAARAMAVRMMHLAQHDFLTNLPNRVLLNDRTNQAIRHAKRDGSNVAVLFLDLDKFKHINDSLGHDIGDKLLLVVAERLCACVRHADTVSRLGGDEFVILLSEQTCTDNIALTADKLIASLSTPQIVGDHELHITTSIGIAIYPGDGDTPDMLIKNADTAMYQAKENGRNNYQFFKKEMNQRAVERQVIESNLRNALARDELALHFQPKVNLETGEITGSEALIRWMHPKWGMTPPLRFIKIAEECGLIVPIGRWVLRAACSQAKTWRDAGLDPGPVAVNVSALEFRHKDFVQGVQTILADTGLAPNQLQLEITESVLMHDVASSAEVLTKLKDMGVELAVDDFGTGYSSLSYLMRFPIDALKIDQSFVHGIDAGANNGIIVSAVINMGNSLKHCVIAEGVERLSQLSFLKAHHCQEAQGYIFSQPLPSPQFAALLSTGIPAGALVSD